MDILTPEERSKVMSSIRSKNTRPELRIRKALHALGFRYRLHTAILGKPDIYLPKYKVAIFINGCFWHGHDCSLFKQPATRTEFWMAKISNNKKRDQKVLETLQAENIRICVVWECALRGKGIDKFSFLIEKIKKWILSSQSNAIFSGTWLTQNYPNTSDR